MSRPIISLKRKAEPLVPVLVPPSSSAEARERVKPPPKVWQQAKRPNVMTVPPPLQPGRYAVFARLKGKSATFFVLHDTFEPAYAEATRLLGGAAAEGQVVDIHVVRIDACLWIGADGKQFAKRLGAEPAQGSAPC